MANRQHVKSLSQGVETWNKWRQKHPEVNIDLSRANLIGVFFNSANLSLPTL